MGFDIIAAAAPYRSLCTVGLCKNAGKTTVLCALIDGLSKIGRVVGISSIGLDGEQTDEVTATAKPRIFLPRGCLFATASSLAHSGIGAELLCMSGIHTPLGEVAAARAVSSGYIELAGPSIASQLPYLMDILRSHGADNILIDGAIGRRSLAAPLYCDSAILCCGASYSPDMRMTVRSAAFVCELFAAKADRSLQGLYPLSKNLYTRDGEPVEAKSPDEAVANGANSIILCGAATDAALLPLCKAVWETLTIAVFDPSRFLISREVYKALRSRGASFAVARGIELLCVTINPFSAYGAGYNKKEFKDAMQSAIRLPVIDVEEEQH